jgi:hypothetical protein
MHKSNNGCFWIALEPGLFGEVFGMASYSTENSEEPVSPDSDLCVNLAFFASTW